VGPRAGLDDVEKRKFLFMIYYSKCYRFMNGIHNVWFCFRFAFWVLKVVINEYCNLEWIWGSSVGKATGCGLGLFPPGTRDFSLLHRVQTGYGANSASYPVGTVGDYSGYKATGA
jgi:hypothetical protein